MSLRSKKTMSKKRRAAPRRRLPRRAFRPARSVADYAGVSENQTITAAGGGNFQTGQMYAVRQTQLAQFPRAANVSLAYQHYRIKKITLTLKPSYDTFQQGVGLAGKCRAYYMIDKSGSIPQNVTLENLKQMGAKPINFDEKPIQISWRPSVLEAAWNSATLAPVQTRYRVSPWLATNNNPATVAPWAPSQIDHLGVFFYVDQMFAAGTFFMCELNVEFQFKKPLVRVSPQAPPALGIKPAILDDSPDGIVGGSDTNIVSPSL